MEQTIIARKNESDVNEGNVSTGTKKRRNISVNEDVYNRLLKHGHTVIQSVILWLDV